jgi:hypothetical protein
VAGAEVGGAEVGGAEVGCAEVGGADVVGAEVGRAPEVGGDVRRAGVVLVGALVGVPRRVGATDPVGGGRVGECGDRVPVVGGRDREADGVGRPSGVVESEAAAALGVEVTALDGGIRERDVDVESQPVTIVQATTMQQQQATAARTRRFIRQVCAHVSPRNTQPPRVPGTS